MKQPRLPVKDPLHLVASSAGKGRRIFHQIWGWEIFTNIPTEGTVYINYKCAPEDRNFKVPAVSTFKIIWELGDGGMDLPKIEKKAPFLELFKLLFALVYDIHQIRSPQHGETIYSYRESTFDM